MRKLIELARNGDGTAFAKLMSSVKSDLYRVAKGYLSNDDDAADAISATVLSCFEHLSQLREPRYFKTWLIRILINECAKIAKENRRFSAANWKVEPTYQDEIAQNNLDFQMLMSTLDEQYRLILILRYAEDMSVKEIATTTGLSVSAVKQRLKRGREKARRLYETQRMEAGR